MRYRGDWVANEKNLKPFTSNQSHEEAVKNGQKGGRESAKKRKTQKAYKALLQEIFCTEVQDEKMRAFAEIYGVNNPDVKTLTILGMVSASISGNHKAFETLLELSGEKQKDSNADVLKKLDKVLGDIDAIADE